jgi:hypothetical protein
LYDLSGTDDPTVLATEASPGTTYRVLRDGAPKLYIKIDEGTTTNWMDISGGVYTGINVGAGAEVLKQLVANQFQFRTLVAGAGIVITQNANTIEIAATGSSGVEVCYPVSLTTLAAGYQTIFTYSPADLTVARLSANLIARRDDGTAHALFDRVGEFHREGASVAVDALNWHMPTTVRSSVNLDVKYVLSGASVLVQVKPESADKCYWKGQVCLIELSTLP